MAWDVATRRFENKKHRDVVHCISVILDLFDALHRQLDSQCGEPWRSELIHAMSEHGRGGSKQQSHLNDETALGKWRDERKTYQLLSQTNPVELRGSWHSRNEDRYQNGKWGSRGGVNTSWLHRPSMSMAAYLRIKNSSSFSFREVMLLP